MTLLACSPGLQCWTIKLTNTKTTPAFYNCRQAGRTRQFGWENRKSILSTSLLQPGFLWEVLHLLFSYKRIGALLFSPNLNLKFTGHNLQCFYVNTLMRSDCVVLCVKYSWAGLGNFNKLNLLWRNIGCQSPHQRTPCRFESLTCLGYVSSWHYRDCRIYHFKIFLITPAKTASSFTEADLGVKWSADKTIIN